MTAVMNLIGDKVMLIPMVSEDKDDFFILATQSDGSNYWYDEKQKSALNQDQFFQDWTDAYFDPAEIHGGQCFWIEVSKRCIGQINYNQIDIHNLKTELDIIIGNASDMGKGYGTDALKTLSNYLFSQLHLHKLWIEARANNPRAMSAYAKAGFQQEAILKDEYFFNGAFVDGVRMARFK